MISLRVRPFLLFLATVFSLLPPAINAKINRNDQFQWQILSSNNFSSQIRLHSHALVFITVPWCGESRSVMNAISHKLDKEQPKYSSFKLMLVYRNVDKTVADSLDGAEGITVLFYHRAMPYKYRGILRVQNILSTVDYFISLTAEDLPLRGLSNSEDLKTFLGSTDKAVLLFESCGWTSKFLIQHFGNETLRGNPYHGFSNQQTDGTLASGRQKNFKVDGIDINCDAQHGCGDSAWVGKFSAENETASQPNEDIQPPFGTTCTFEEYVKFKSFFSKFMAFARDAYFPHQRQRYGRLSDRSLLSTLGIEDSDKWSLIISYAGCPGCLRKFRDESYLRNALVMHDQPVMELLDDVKGLRSALPVDKPSVVLFVDRTSDSLETQKECHTALGAFRELALQGWKSHPLNWQRTDRPKQSLHSYQGSTKVLQNHRLLPSSSSEINLKDKMSIMIINDGKQVTLGNAPSHLQSGSLHEVLTFLVEQKRQGKLSSYVKEAGFQLLSDEMDVKIADQSSFLGESWNKDSSIILDGSSVEIIHDKPKHSVDNVSPLMDQEKHFQSPNVETPSMFDDQKAFTDVASKVSGIMDPNQVFNYHDDPHLDLNIQAEAENDYSEGRKHPFNVFKGSFFFCDGNYKFLRSLTSDSEVPRVVIVDPLSQQHYVLSKEANYSVNSVSSFIDGYLNGSLIPHQHSGIFRNTLEVPQPPFVNLDFHEKLAIPSLTADTFSELVLGSNESDLGNAINAWHMDVVVLFSTRWCGFCHRMDLIVREVYRALKGYINMVKSKSKCKELFSQEGLKDGLPKLPVFYSIDCTMNDCSWILKSMGQMEVYPSLVLFPAEKKTPIVYDGNMVVTDIIKFLANNGSSSHYLLREIEVPYGMTGKR